MPYNYLDPRLIAVEELPRLQRGDVINKSNAINRSAGSMRDFVGRDDRVPPEKQTRKSRRYDRKAARKAAQEGRSKLSRVGRGLARGYGAVSILGAAQGSPSAAGTAVALGGPVAGGTALALYPRQAGAGSDVVDMTKPPALGGSYAYGDKYGGESNVPYSSVTGDSISRNQPALNGQISSNQQRSVTALDKPVLTAKDQPEYPDGRRVGPTLYSPDSQATLAAQARGGFDINDPAFRRSPEQLQQARDDFQRQVDYFDNAEAKRDRKLTLRQASITPALNQGIGQFLQAAQLRNNARAEIASDQKQQELDATTKLTQAKLSQPNFDAYNAESNRIRAEAQALQAQQQEGRYKSITDENGNALVLDTQTGAVAPASQPTLSSPPPGQPTQQETYETRLRSILDDPNKTQAERMAAIRFYTQRGLPLPPDIAARYAPQPVAP